MLPHTLLRSINPALRPAGEQVLLQSLEKRPERRYPSSMALLDALDTAQFGYASHQSPRVCVLPATRAMCYPPPND